MIQFCMNGPSRTVTGSPTGGVGGAGEGGEAGGAGGGAFEVSPSAPATAAPAAATPAAAAVATAARSLVLRPIRASSGALDPGGRGPLLAGPVFCSRTRRRASSSAYRR